MTPMMWYIFEKEMTKGFWIYSEYTEYAEYAKYAEYLPVVFLVKRTKYKISESETSIKYDICPNWLLVINALIISRSTVLEIKSG